MLILVAMISLAISASAEYKKYVGKVVTQTTYVYYSLSTGEMVERDECRPVTKSVTTYADNESDAKYNVTSDLGLGYHDLGIVTYKGQRLNKFENKLLVGVDLKLAR